ncbi:alpha/beta hydrolase [Salicibibacter cibarius]|uniref:Alpha/beta hydrolase n=1 Tax=Salicibibacter cibarius TaxID=2743000 RepID=A0A7T7CCI8_9BACI|nr:alpha/beta hydrolase [Salicibibacter cibarius]QQK77027.1 alpha/beta hydrolase [Salicibibacter cibarius]
MQQDSKTVSKEYVYINGIKQGLILETTDENLPVLLVVHGGPGYPLYPIVQANDVQFHHLFTVCYWDQRGTGLSYTSDKKGLTIDQLVNDTIEVSNYLIQKFSKEKVYMMGHSWGTIIGSKAASIRPDLFHAYIGVGQIGSQSASEKETYNAISEKVRATGNEKWISEINSVNYSDAYYKDRKYFTIVDKSRNKFGGGFLREGYPNSQGLRDVFGTRQYSLKERMNVFRGLAIAYQAFGEKMAKTDLTTEISEINTDVYIFQGRHDYLTTHRQALRFYDHLKAPKKNFYTFENVSHTPFIEEQSAFLEKLQNEVLSS